VRNSAGEIIGASKIARDISERKRAELLVQEAETQRAADSDAHAKLTDWTSQLWHSRHLHEGLDAMLDVVIDLLGADRGNIQLLDPPNNVPRIVAQRGFQPEFLEFFQEVSWQDASACGRASRANQRVVIEDIEADALYEPIRAVARAAGYRAVVSTPLIAGEGTLLGVVSIHFRSVHRPSEAELRRLDLFTRQASDFIQRSKIEQALKKSEEALREADCRKDEFLALIAHELRNPLAPVRYALATMKNAQRTLDQQKRAEEVIERQVAQMSRLLDDLLDVSRITRGAVELKKSRTELTVALGSAIEAARPMLDTKHHMLSLDLPKYPVRLDADPVRLTQIFSNLIINAAKYTDRGGHIQVRAAQEGHEVVVAVRDNGIGISAEMMPKLFTFFTQAHPALERTEGGLGVGLALVRALVTLHGGHIEANSEGVNKGSEFIVRFPIDALAPTASAVHEEPLLP
jgi:signal transduction histidine kinase